MSNICFCIPARYESTRLSCKLLLKLGEDSCIRKTIKQVMKSKSFNNNIYIFTDSVHIKEEIEDLPCNIIMTNGNYRNGSERISKNLNLINKQYNIIINVQADEPYISHKNIDYCIENHLKNNTNNLFYTTLHEETNSIEYLKSTASLKLIVDNDNNVLYYSRNIIPWNKNNEIVDSYNYKTFTGIYIYNRNMLEIYGKMNDTPLQLMEDCEQLKILENGYKIKSFPTVEYNEISLNTIEDYNFLKKKYV